MTAVPSEKANVKLIDDFYNQLWNRWDFSIAERLLHPQLEFRGSIGLAVRGIDGFLGYMERMRATFPDFHTEMQLLLADGNQVVSKQLYSGTQEGAFFDVQATHRSVEYAGTGFFTILDGLIEKVWVLGDLITLYRQLGREIC